MKADWTRLALDDAAQAYAYIAQDSPTSAAAVIDRIEGAVAMLSRHPEAGRSGRVAGTRELVVPGTPFIIVYRLERRRLAILAVIHASRRWPDSLD